MHGHTGADALCGRRVQTQPTAFDLGQEFDADTVTDPVVEVLLETIFG